MIFSGNSYTCREGLRCNWAGSRMKGVEITLISQCESDPSCVAYAYSSNRGGQLIYSAESLSNYDKEDLRFCINSRGNSSYNIIIVPLNIWFFYAEISNSLSNCRHTFLYYNIESNLKYYFK